MNERRTIEMRAVNPLVGTVLEYRGWYRHVDGPRVGAAGEQPPGAAQKE